MIKCSTNATPDDWECGSTSSFDKLVAPVCGAGVSGIRACIATAQQRVTPNALLVPIILILLGL
ncbi:MAG: hypothetical protein M3Y72_17260 [Acidobacteriota bacterium]|nr:hypothetical protein [Acidobacteriota bacterium]